MKVMRSAAFLSLSILCGVAAHAVTIPTVPIGNPGNPADMRYRDPSHPTGVGAVGYTFFIGKTEVTHAQYVTFLNAVAATDNYGLYNTNMDSSTWGGIIRAGSPGSFTYAVKPAAIVGYGPLAGTTYRYDDKPVVFVSSADAMRFANWLHNGQPTGLQDASTTEGGAYTLNGARSIAALSAVTRNPGARWWLPSEDEWYKAAYHNNDGITANYWNFPTGTDNVPNNRLPLSDTGNSANFTTGRYTTGNFEHPMTDVGAYLLSDSPYGTFDQGGNVLELNESLFDGSLRGVRGGAWSHTLTYLRASTWDSFSQQGEYAVMGFRVASIPEPATTCLVILSILVVLLWRKGGS